MDDTNAHDVPAFPCDAILAVDTGGHVVAMRGRVPGLPGVPISPTRGELDAFFPVSVEVIEDAVIAARKSDAPPAPCRIEIGGRSVEVAIAPHPAGAYLLVSDITDATRSRARDEAVAALSADVGFVVASGGAVVAVTPGAAMLLADDTLTGRDFVDLVHGDDRVLTLGWLTGDAAPQAACEIRLRHRDGGWRWVQCRAIRCGVDEVVIAGHDVTSNRADVALIGAQRAVLEYLSGEGEQATALEAIVTLIESDTGGGLAAVYLACDAELELGAAPSLPTAWARAALRVDLAVAGSSAGSIEPLAGRAGELAAEHQLGFGWCLAARAGNDDDGVCGAVLLFLGVKRFLTASERAALQRASQLLAAVASHDRRMRRDGEQRRLDHLTGVLDRRTFIEQLATPPVNDTVIVLIKVLALRTINRDLGYVAGDTVLRAVATELHATLRTRDMLARVGGTTFAIVGIARRARSGQSVLVERVRAAVASKIAAAGQAVAVECAVVEVAAAPDETALALLCRAEDALVEAAARPANRSESRLQTRSGSAPADR